MHVRELRASDLGAVRRLLGELGYETSAAVLEARVDAVLGAAQHRLIVAEDRDSVIGVLHVFERPSLEKGAQAVVQSMVVDAGHRRAGVGRALLDEAQAWASERGLDAVVLHTRTDRDDAHAFYARNGFQTMATSRLMRRAIAS